MLKMHGEYLHMHYLQELKMAESKHCVEEVINEDNEVNRNKFMHILVVYPFTILNYCTELFSLFGQIPLLIFKLYIIWLLWMIVIMTIVVYCSVFSNA